MVTQQLPKTSGELKAFILKTIEEVSERIVPYISEDEQQELEKTYGESLHENDYSSKQSTRL